VYTGLFKSFKECATATAKETDRQMNVQRCKTRPTPERAADYGKRGGGTPEYTDGGVCYQADLVTNVCFPSIRYVRRRRSKEMTWVKR
jgi:hypothetical protein